MNGKENIINKILADADAKCSEIIAQAELQAQQIALSAQQAAQSEKDVADRRLDSLKAERIRNSLASAQLEGRKYKLGQKQQLIAACYQKVYDQLKNLSGDSRKKFLSKLLANFAEKGETVLITKADKDIVTQKFLDGLGLGLTLGKTFVDADGGVVLCGNGYDKDLTLKTVVAFAREQTEGAVAAVLFGE